MTATIAQRPATFKHLDARAWVVHDDRDLLSLLKLAMASIQHCVMRCRMCWSDCASRSTDERIEGLETGADDSMAKSFLWRELQLQLERCCQMHGGRLALNRSSLGGLQAELHLPKN
jgi:hypothetical protein